MIDIDKFTSTLEQLDIEHTVEYYPEYQEILVRILDSGDLADNYVDFWFSYGGSFSSFTVD